MKTTIDIPDAALADAMRFTGAKTKREAVLIVSNGVQSKVGSLTATWGHFGDWKKAASFSRMCWRSIRIRGLQSIRRWGELLGLKID